jgi:hypothetical protein
MVPLGRVADISVANARRAVSRAKRKPASLVYVCSPTPGVPRVLDRNFQIVSIMGSDDTRRNRGSNGNLYDDSATSQKCGVPRRPSSHTPLTKRSRLGARSVALRLVYNRRAMLTDIFAERYANRVIWPAYSEAEKKLLMQCYRMVEELFPYWVDGKVAKGAEKQWKSIHDPLSMELGLSDLGPPLTGWSTLDQVCKNFVTASYDGTVTPDRFIKERLSFIELAFRLRGEELRDMNAELPVKTAAAELADAFKAHRSGVSGGTTAERIAAYNKSLNLNFGRSVAELNERLRRAGAPRLASLDNAIAKSGPFASTAPIPQLSTGFGPPLTSSDSNSNSPAGSDTTQFFW